MFQGVVPKECIAQILRVSEVEKWGRVYNCCSGTFRFEQITLGTHPSVEMHSNDVSLYSSAIAGYVLDKPLDYEFHGDLEFVNELGYREPDQRLAALAVGFNLGRFAGGKANAYKVKHRDHLIENFGLYVERTLEKVRKLPGMIPIASYAPRDWLLHMEEAIDRKAAIFSYPPFYKCLAPEHRLLTADLRWVPCGDLREGDEILAFEEYPQPGQRCRRWQRAVITHSSPAVKPCVRVHLANGEVITCTTDHPWLVDLYDAGGKRGWLTADKIEGRYVVKALDTWEQDRTYEAGWLAGILDGEGSFVGSANTEPKLQIAQRPGVVTEQIKATASRLGFEIGISTPKSGVHQFWFAGGLPSAMRALGTLRPQRLLGKFAEFEIARKAIRSNGTPRVLVERVEHIGEHPVQSISTSSRTYIGEGYLMHNSGYEKMFEFLTSNMKWDAPKYEIFDPKNLRGIIERVRQAGVPYCILSDQIYEDIKPELEFVSGRGHPHYCYVSTGKSSFLQLAPREQAFRYKTFDIGKLQPDSVVSVTKAEGKQMTFLKNVYLKKGIMHSPGVANYLVHIDGMLIGGLIYAEQRHREKGTIYLLSDFSISREGRLSKLIARLALNGDILRDVDKRMMERYTTVKTTAFSDHPVSMKYRGIFDLAKRIEKNEPEGRFMLNYVGARIEETPQQAFRWWYGKHFKR